MVQVSSTNLLESLGLNIVEDKTLDSKSSMNKLATTGNRRNPW